MESLAGDAPAPANRATVEAGATGRSAATVNGAPVATFLQAELVVCEQGDGEAEQLEPEPVIQRW